MTDEHLAYLRSLPRKRMGAGCLLVNEYDEVLLVQPSYKPTWEIPGGVVEENESPRAACWREVQEELGLERPLDHLLVVDYAHATATKTEALMFIFDGGLLTPADIASLQLPPKELKAFAFFPIAHLPETLTASLRWRIQRAWEQRAIRQGIYVENPLY